ncbi:MAG: plasmid pRiA4b ORF-3 family protein [Treponema sp.]|nr:plasmid pRiA4b ORF-3 family protein [Treponema sp.]
MTVNQEDALYDFLENVTEPFSLDDITSFVRMVEPRRGGRLAGEIAALIESRQMAFPMGGKRWISRRGVFEPASFVITPTWLEIANGILIPGHRCLPWANPALLPQEYCFRWKGKVIPPTTTEAEPEEFYPFFTLFGEEYAPQYVARDNPANEEAYNADAYEDPPEVSIHTVDMRNIYRECSFVPGDRFVVKTADWKEGIFDLERIEKGAWSGGDIDTWIAAAETGFLRSFEYLGPASSTEEQIAFAVWFGGERLRETPALSMEEFLYSETDRIETAPYGIETRFWYAGKDIPDRKDLEGIRSLPDRTVVEEMLLRHGVPISEYVIQAYVRDDLYRCSTRPRETPAKTAETAEQTASIEHIIERIIPPSAALSGRDREYLAGYVSDVWRELKMEYSPFVDGPMGSIRQRVAELHTAVVELAARIQKSDIDPSWLPNHTFVVLSQIQGHAASMLEDLDSNETPPSTELDAMENSADSMIETYEDIRDLINEALHSYRKSNFSLLKKNAGAKDHWYTVQISLGGTGIWRRLVLPAANTLRELYVIIQNLFGWKDEAERTDPLTEGLNAPGSGTQVPGHGAFEPSPHKEEAEAVERPTRLIEGFFSAINAGPEEAKISKELTIGELRRQGTSEFLCEAGARWTVKIMILSLYQPHPGERISCVAGEGAAPPRFIDGPLRFRRFISALERDGGAYDPERFDLESCNKSIRGLTTSS